MDDPIFRPREAATYLGIGLTMLYQLVKADKLPRPIKVGHRASGWRRSSLNAYISRRQAATEADGA
jgi:prophage regulatory protein